MSFSETLFKTNIGVDTYSPDIAEGSALQVVRLKNLQPGFGRWTAPSGNTTRQVLALDNVFRALPHYSEPLSQVAHLYAVSDTSIYVLNFTTGLFEVVAIYSALPNSNDVHAWTPWLDQVYLTKRNAGLLKLKNNLATLVADAPSGRYMIIADSHLMLLNVVEGGTSAPVRVRWSDLYNPERWDIATDSEADFYELSPDDSEGTGLSYQRGLTIIYTRSRIWTARYTPGNETTVGKFKFETLYNDVGNIYHGAKISVKEVDYFINKDNFYKLEGFQLSEIGDPIWKYFSETIVDTNFQNTVLALNDSSRNEVSWTYDHVDGMRWSVVYNYKENKWSDRDPQDVYSVLSLNFPFRGYIPISALLHPFTFYTLPTYIITGDWQYLDLNASRLFGGSGGKVYEPRLPATYVKADNSPFECMFETFEFDFDNIMEVKEFDAIKLLFTRLTGVRFNSTLALTIGYRSSHEEDVSWSQPILLKTQQNDDTIFKFRRDGVGHLVRLRFTWNNTTDWAITQIVKLSLTKLEDDGQPIDEK